MKQQRVLTLTLLLLLSFFSFTKADYLPVVIWHGMGDTCCWSFSMGAIQKLIEETLPGIYVHSLMIGDDLKDDEWNGFFMNVNDQIAFANKNISMMPELKNGFNAIGFSQGGQFLRAYVERYNNPPVHNLISVGGQHQGVFGFPRCPGANVEFCNLVREMINWGVYDSIVQDHLVQAEYWQDPLKEDLYYNFSVFLADINNVREEKNQTYVENFKSVNEFVMVQFLNDTMVQPKESEWFGWYAPGQDVETVPYNATLLYTEDWIGLRELDEQGKLVFLATIGNHLQFTDEWFVENIILPHLNVTVEDRVGLLSAQ